MPRRRYHRVGVLFGGPSAEREVSLDSGKAVVSGLREAGYECDAVELPAREFRIADGVEAVFIALHGEFGEDGQIQAELDRQGMPYTGSGAVCSRRCMDKRRSKEVFRAAGIPTPEYELLQAGGTRTLPLPVVVKPVAQGSSIGVHRVRKEAEWNKAVENTLLFGPEVLVESYIAGRELTVGIVDRDVFPVVEIVAPNAWYDFGAKYRKGSTRYIVPAELDSGTTESCLRVAREAFEALGCRGFGRVDMRLSEDGQPYVLELNTIPGFTATSLLPKAAASVGVSFPDLCDRIMATATCDSPAPDR